MPVRGTRFSIEVSIKLMGFCGFQIKALEERRKQVVQGILGVQKYFRGCHSRGNFHELKQAAATLQSGILLIFIVLLLVALYFGAVLFEVIFSISILKFHILSVLTLGLYNPIIHIDM